MKPRLKFCRGLWHCATGPNTVRGVGCTPARAYTQWRERTQHHAIAIARLRAAVDGLTMRGAAAWAVVPAPVAVKGVWVAA